MDGTESLRALLDASRGQENWGAGSAGTRRPGGSGSATDGVATADRSSVSQTPVFGEFVGQGDAPVADDELLPFTVGDLGDASPASGHETRRNNAVVLTSVAQAGTQEGTREREDHSVHSRLSIKRYRGFFDVDTSDVALRIGSALAFWRGGDFVNGLNGSPDLYGPFWIASTLVFVSAAAANTAGYIAHQAKKSGDDSSASAYWYYDVDKVGGSMALFYGYIGVVGVGMWAAMKYLKASTASASASASASLATVWCVYGYALAVFVPVSVACVVPSDTARWVLVMTATAVSGAFLLQNVRVCLNMGGSEMEGGKGAGGVVLAVAAALHAGLGLALKFVFFDY